VRTIEELVRELKTGEYDAVDFRPRPSPIARAIPVEAK